jgi:hypothetical protein
MDYYSDTEKIVGRNPFYNTKENIKAIGLYAAVMMLMLRGDPTGFLFLLVLKVGNFLFKRIILAIDNNSVVKK